MVFPSSQAAASYRSRSGMAAKFDWLGLDESSVKSDSLRRDRCRTATAESRTAVPLPFDSEHAPASLCSIELAAMT